MRPCETPSPARGWCEALALAAVLAVLPGPGAAQAQAQPTPAATSPAVDPAFAAAATAFERLPEADRKLIQDGLIWTGDFTGAATGGFGPLTYRGIQAFQKRAGVKPDGILQPRERAALDQLAARARDAVRFTRVLDARSGARIGVPQKLLDRTRQSPAGTVFASADGAATLELLSPAGELQPLYDLLRTEQPGRKVAYKVLRPDWFVVSGDDRGRRFYTRVNATPGGLRGYTLTYPAGRAAEFDRIAIAVANSFETGPAATAGNANPGLLTPAPAPAGVPPRQVDAARLFSGLVTGAATVVTVAAVEACASPTVDRQGARVVAVDKARGLAVLEVPGLPAPRGGDLRSAAPSDADPLLALAQTVLGRETQLSVVPAEARVPATGAPRLFAPLQRGAAGAAVFDRTGALVGLVAAVAAEPRVVAGVMPQASWPLVPAADVLAVARLAPAAANAPAPPLTAGGVAAAHQGRVVAIDCAR